MGIKVTATFHASNATVDIAEAITAAVAELTDRSWGGVVVRIASEADGVTSWSSHEIGEVRFVSAETAEDSEPVDQAVTDVPVAA